MVRFLNHDTPRDCPTAVEHFTPCRDTHVAKDEPAPVPAEGSAGSAEPSKFRLKLFVAGADSRAQAAIANLRRICDEELPGRYELEIIDVLEQPEEAEHARILATPTLIKQLPPPLRRVIGDLSDRDRLLLGLEIRSSPSTVKTETA